MRLKLVVPLVLIFLLPSAIINVGAQPTLAGAPSSIQPPTRIELDDVVNMTVDERGLIHVKEELKATAAAFQEITSMFPTPFMLKRLLETDKQHTHMENISIKYDTLSNKIVATYDLVGMAIKRAGSWQILVEKEAKLTARTGNTFVFTYMIPISDGKMTTVVTLKLPNSATDVKVKHDQDYMKILYNVPSSFGGGNILIYGLISVLAILLILNIVLKDGLLGLLRKGRKEEGGGGSPPTP